MAVSPEISGVSIVFLGSFNPVIFQPAWFAAQGLIRQEEADQADVKIIHADVVAFQLPSAVLEVQHERFTVGSTGLTETPATVRDLAIATFTILKHSPISSMGINFDAHFRVEERDPFDRIGWTLAPKEPWGDVLTRPGMRSLTVEGIRPDERNGYIRVTVEPSVRVLPHGLYVSINDHIALAAPDAEVLAADDALDALKTRWDDSEREAEEIHTQLLALV